MIRHKIKAMCFTRKNRNLKTVKHRIKEYFFQELSIPYCINTDDVEISFSTCLMPLPTYYFIRTYLLIKVCLCTCHPTDWKKLVIIFCFFFCSKKEVLELRTNIEWVTSRCKDAICYFKIDTRTRKQTSKNFIWHGSVNGLLT